VTIREWEWSLLGRLLQYANDRPCSVITSAAGELPPAGQSAVPSHATATSRLGQTYKSRPPSGLDTP